MSGPAVLVPCLVAPLVCTGTCMFHGDGARGGMGMMRWCIRCGLTPGIRLWSVGRDGRVERLGLADYY